ncbi:MAG: flagellar biosynthesis anti-sigma factor FlgM [Sphingobium sp.]
MAWFAYQEFKLFCSVPYIGSEEDEVGAMIKPVGQAMSAAIESVKLRETTQANRSAAPATPATTARAAEGAAMTSPAARLAQDGAPIDVEKIARIKAAISSGNYPVDAVAIADRMVELDLPKTFN